MGKIMSLFEPHELVALQTLDDLTRGRTGSLPTTAVSRFLWEAACKIRGLEHVFAATVRHLQKIGFVETKRGPNWAIWKDAEYVIDGHVLLLSCRNPNGERSIDRTYIRAAIDGQTAMIYGGDEISACRVTREGLLALVQAAALPAPAGAAEWLRSRALAKRLGIAQRTIQKAAKQGLIRRRRVHGRPDFEFHAADAERAFRHHTQ